MRAKQSLSLTIAAALAGSLFGASGVANDRGDRGPEIELEPVVTVASRRAQPAKEVAGTVSVIEREQIERQLIQSISDLVRYEPGMSVPGDAARFGPTGFSIRGIDGNRVGMLIDGVPVRDDFAIGSFSRSGRNVVDPALLSRVEILRGPASTLYGSDALGGVLSFRTLSSADVLSLISADRGVRAEVNTMQRDQSFNSNAVAAFEADGYTGFFGVVDRRGHERANNPREGGLSANPQKRRERTTLFKMSGDMADGPLLEFSAQHRSSRIETTVQSLVRGPAQYATTSAMLGNDRDQESRAALSAQFEPSGRFFNAFQALLYWQDSRVDQRTQQWRDAAPPRTPATLRDRQFLFDQVVVGVDLQAQSSWMLASWANEQVLGVDFRQTRVAEMRDASETNLSTGAVNHVVIGERFPVRDFPRSAANELGLYWQNQLRIGEHFALIPGARYERYRVDARSDAIFADDNPGLAIADLHSDSVTPKLGMHVDLSDRVQLFGQYARGFRKPPISDLNIGFTIPAFNYIAIPNSDLQPERSVGLELGARASGVGHSLELVVFSNRYRNLIESRVNLGRNDAGQLVFQSQNRSRAQIDGIEAKFSSVLPWSGFAVNGAVALSRGRDLNRDSWLNSVDPSKLSVGLSYQSANWRHRIEVVGTAIARQSKVDTSVDNPFRSPGVGLIDLYWNWQLNNALTIDAGAFNLGNRRYWLWSGVRGLDTSARELDLYTQPGRQLGLSARLTW